MHRLVIALTTLLTLVGIVVVAGYVFIFAAQADRMARAVPSGASVYATAYLQPSAGQKLNLASLLGHVPGFADPASLDQKIHEIAGRLLADAGLDYEGDLRPWLGDQVAVAVEPDGLDPQAADVLLLVDVKDREEAVGALERLTADLGLQGAAQDYQGTQLTVAESASWALLDDVLLVGSSEAIVKAAIDANADRADSLADSPRFERAMESVPPDHLASIYVDLAALAGAADVGDQLGGYSTASLALVVQPNGLQLAGSAPFTAEAAPSPAREAFALASEPSSLSDWMPDGTQLEAVVFGLSQTLRAAEQQLTAQDPGGDVQGAVDQLRAIAALGLGINVDGDLLPLFNRESALAVSGLDSGQPHGQLLLRPSDPDAAAAALERMRLALEDRGATSDRADVEGSTITSIQVPDVATLAYAMHDGVIVVGMSVDDVGASLAVQAHGSSLAEDDRYRAAWDLAGTRGGNEIWVDAGAMLDAAGADLGLTGDLRDILLQVGSVAMTAPADEDHSEFHFVVTVR
jgi:Protein of unknown function (DUF3352)